MASMGVLHVLRFVTALAGLLLSLYTAYIYKQKQNDPEYEALCDISESISCSDVISSRYAKGFGLFDNILASDSLLKIPNFVLAIVFFISYFSVAASGHFTYLLLPAATTSLLMSLYLFYILNWVMEVHCLVCYSAYAVSFALFLIEIRLTILNRHKLKST